MRTKPKLPKTLFVIWLTVLLGIAWGDATAAEIGRFLDRASPADLVPGADRLGPAKTDPPVIPAYRGDELLDTSFHSDIANSVGYSGGPSRSWSD